jgi:histidyl-tRNA synthetase
MIKTVKGFKDILPEENLIRSFIESKGVEILEANGFKKITTPVLEKTELFLRSIGETSDIVQKEMYTFEDKNGDILSLRPEGTAPVVRAFIENSLHTKPETHKYYYYGPMFRRERPQKGRLRQFYQFGVEVFGNEAPLTDAHTIYVLSEFLKKINLQNVVIELNSVGCDNCRPVFERALKTYFSGKKEYLCNDCKLRLEKNPLRILDCKREGCKALKNESPSVLEYLCEDCKEYHFQVKKFLGYFNVKFIENRFMVRGLDYYTRTVFEAVSEGLGAQNAVGAGGRYNNLVKEIGGKNIPGIGFALGIERLVILLNEKLVVTSGPDFYLVILGEDSLEKGVEIYKNLTKQGFKGEFDYELKGLKNQLKKADKFGAKFALILGEEEISKGKIKIKDMLSGSQQEIVMEDIAESLRIN